MESNPPTVARRLAAILAADAANFSGLVAEDEERTLQLLSRHRAVIDRTIQAHDGRIFTTAGDSVLAEFASPVEAVRAAIEIQRHLASVATRSAEGRPMRFRIGINVGDIVAEGNNIMGDGVNVAVRLESIAQPGAILVSANVRDHVVGKITEALEDLGHQILKNIPRPVRAYRVMFDDEERQRLAARARHTRLRYAFAVTTALVLALGVSGWWTMHRENPSMPGQATSASPADATHDERAFWRSVAQSSDPAELQAFLKKYPKSTFSELAQARLNGLLAASERFSQNADFAQKSAEAAHAQAEAAKLKGEADAAIARAATEQATAMRLKTEAELAAARASAAAKAVADVQHKLAGTIAPANAIDENVVLVRATGPYDGRWMSDWNCEASADQPSSTVKLPVLIQLREIRIETGQAGLPGYFRAYGRIGDDGRFELKGMSLPRTQRIVGAEQALAASGRGELDKLEGQGSIGGRRCAVLIARGSTQ